MIGEKASDLIKSDWGYFVNNYEKVGLSINDTANENKPVIN
jgi:hypothetical protein